MKKFIAALTVLIHLIIVFNLKFLDDFYSIIGTVVSTYLISAVVYCFSYKSVAKGLVVGTLISSFALVSFTVFLSYALDGA